MEFRYAFCLFPLLVDPGYGFTYETFELLFPLCKNRHVKPALGVCRTRQRPGFRDDEDQGRQGRDPTKDRKGVVGLKIIRSAQES